MTGGGQGPADRLLSYPLQGRVGLEVTVVQIGVHGLPACSSADFQLQHVFQTLHHLKKPKTQELDYLA